MLSFLFPPICPLCGKQLLDQNRKICEKCEKADIFVKEPVCCSCGKPLEAKEQEYCMDCIRHPKNFEKGMGLCVYKEPVIHSLAAIKYKNQREFAEYYIGEIRKRKGKQLKNLCPDVIVPVPLYPGKRRRRGFNQAELFAKGISEILNCPVEKNLVKRVKETKASKNLNPQERKKNLRHAFEGSKKYYEKIGKPKTALIVDDIYTTGATAEGVAEALKKTGVQKVYVFCIAVGTGNA